MIPVFMYIIHAFILLNTELLKKSKSAPNTYRKEYTYTHTYMHTKFFRNMKKCFYCSMQWTACESLEKVGLTLQDGVYTGLRYIACKSYVAFTITFHEFTTIFLHSEHESLYLHASTSLSWFLGTRRIWLW